MRPAAAAAALLVASFAPREALARGPTPAGAAPKNDARSVDHAHPERYRDLAALGDVSAIRKAAAGITGKNDVARLRAIHAWMKKSLKADGSGGEGGPRGAARVIAEGKWAGAGEHAAAFGALARAAGIPFVWVLTADADWLRDCVRQPDIALKSWRGWTAGEVFLDGRWALIDTVNLKVWDNYDPRAVVLPHEHVLLERWSAPDALPDTQWREALRMKCRAFDQASIPVGGYGRDLRDKTRLVRATVKDKAMSERLWARIEAQRDSVDYAGLNSQYEERLRDAEGGGTIILVAIGEKLWLPKELRDRYSPASAEAIQEKLREVPSGYMVRELDDGTRVVLLYARDAAGLEREIDRLELPAD